MTGKPTALAPDGGQQQRTLGLEHWAVIASAADLARKATALPTGTTPCPTAVMPALRDGASQSHACVPRRRPHSSSSPP
jgi:hypothetical protein